MDILKHPKMTN